VYLGVKLTAVSSSVALVQEGRRAAAPPSPRPLNRSGSVIPSTQEVEIQRILG
jgi:hypothetical protein